VTKKKAAPRQKTCSRCGKAKADVERCYDPYDLDVNNKKVRCYLCDKCYAARSAEI
jgi:hypothetical protein